MPQVNERLGELLVRRGLITAEQLSAALARQAVDGGKLGAVLVRELVLTENQIAAALAEQKGYALVDLASYPIDPSATVMLPLGMARRRGVIPIAVNASTLTLAMSDPLDVEAIDETEIRTGLVVTPVVAAATQVSFAIDKFIAAGDALLELRDAESATDISVEQSAETSADADVAVVRVVNQLIREAVSKRASDIHFEPTWEGVRVRYRIDGVLREAASLPKSSQAELLSRVKVMADLDITERRRPQDGRIALGVQGKSLDLRVATLPTPTGEAITLRILDSTVDFHSLNDIGLAAAEYDKLRGMLRRPYGALFVSGPTGSGKSTTLYSILAEINDATRKIITIEDPIEYRMPGVTQVAVNSRIGLSFAAGLRTILRSDPDIVMVGEVRDPETAEISVRAALTGHLMLTSIHTNDAPSALTRLNDMQIPPYITSSALIGAVSQRLVRVLCPHCKQAVEVSGDRLLNSGFTEDEIDAIEVFEPVGCVECNNTGYRGRTGVFEVMEFDESLSGLLLREAAADEMRRAAVEKGMKPMRRDALDKVAAGLTSIEEMDRVVIQQ